VLDLTSLKNLFYRWMISGFPAAIYIVGEITGANNQHPALLQRRALNSLLPIASWPFLFHPLLFVGPALLMFDCLYSLLFL